MIKIMTKTLWLGLIMIQLSVGAAFASDSENNNNLVEGDEGVMSSLYCLHYQGEKFPLDNRILEEGGVIYFSGGDNAKKAVEIHYGLTRPEDRPHEALEITIVQPNQLLAADPISWKWGKTLYLKKIQNLAWEEKALKRKAEENNADQPTQPLALFVNWSGWVNHTSQYTSDCALFPDPDELFSGRSLGDTHAQIPTLSREKWDDYLFENAPNKDKNQSRMYYYASHELAGLGKTTLDIMEKSKVLFMCNTRMAIAQEKDQEAEDFSIKGSPEDTKDREEFPEEGITNAAPSIEEASWLSGRNVVCVWWESPQYS